MPKTSLYFLDVYVPNEGDMDTALEIGVLHYDGEHRPQVYLHTFLRPVIVSRVRWSNALGQGITRALITEDHSLPTLKEIIACGFLKGKTVVCLNPELEPCRSLTEGSRSHGLIALWQDTFKDQEEILKLLRPSQMLEYLHLPVQDESNARYTPLLTRLHSLIAVWEFLDACKLNPRLKSQQGQSQLPLSTVWPLPVHAGNPLLRPLHGFEEIPREELRSFFSDALPDFVNWYELKIFSHDWVFKRKKGASIDILNGKKSMCDYIFSRVFDFQMQLWVLIFYALYDRKTDYAREIALSQGTAHKLSDAVREDFAGFLISHLEDFLQRDQKRNIIRAMVRQTLKDKNSESYEDYSFESMQKSDSGSCVFYSYGPEAGGSRCMLEIRRRGGDDILYREYIIAGRDGERMTAADFVNQAFRNFMLEVQEPLSPIWIPRQLQAWIQYITGFAWNDLIRAPSAMEEENLTRARSFLKELLETETLPYRQRLRADLTEVVNAVNAHLHPREDFVTTFTFQGISVKVVSKRDRVSFLNRLLNF